ncbi:uncharacterized protein BDV17DRAFT_290431 [Aspergillus undulatus]|uniref:uncharacterized protein n=1 Tax=Aspergillus undulatus TaxID=1810928 RepID=UPI003CCDA54F
MKLSALTLPPALLASSSLAVDILVRNYADSPNWTKATVSLSVGTNCTELPIAANEVAFNPQSESGKLFKCIFFASLGPECRAPLKQVFSYDEYTVLPGLAQSATCIQL